MISLYKILLSCIIFLSFSLTLSAQENLDLFYSILDKYQTQNHSYIEIASYFKFQGDTVYSTDKKFICHQNGMFISKSANKDVVTNNQYSCVIDHKIMKMIVFSKRNNPGYTVFDMIPDSAELVLRIIELKKEKNNNMILSLTSEDMEIKQIDIHFNLSDRIFTDIIVYFSSNVVEGYCIHYKYGSVDFASNQDLSVFRTDNYFVELDGGLRPTRLYKDYTIVNLTD